MNTGNGGYIQVHNATPTMGGGHQGIGGGYGGQTAMMSKQVVGNGNMAAGAFAHAVSPMISQQTAQPQMGFQTAYPRMAGGQQYGTGAQDPMQQMVMQSMSMPALMQQSPAQQQGQTQAMVMPGGAFSAGPASNPAPPPVLPPTDKLVTNCPMPSYADQMNAAYAAYEQQKFYDQQQQDLLKQLYVSHPFPMELTPEGGAAAAAPTTFMNPSGGQQHFAAGQQYQTNAAYPKASASAHQQRSPNMYSAGAGMGSGDSGNRPQVAQNNASSSNTPKTIPPRNGLGDVTC